MPCFFHSLAMMRVKSSLQWEIFPLSYSSFCKKQKYLVIENNSRDISLTLNMTIYSFIIASGFYTMYEIRVAIYDKPTPQRIEDKRFANLQGRWKFCPLRDSRLL
ncbi:hypothetical protein [Helicobacter sp. T3_23-1059]